MFLILSVTIATFLLMLKNAAFLPQVFKAGILELFDP